MMCSARIQTKSVIALLIVLSSLAWGVACGRNDDIHAAAAAGDVAAVETVLDDAPGQIESRNAEGMTPLLLAASRGHLELVSFLVDRGADINARDASGDTALHGMAWRGDLAAAESLLEQGADVNRPNASGKTPLDVAVQGGHDELVGLLRSKRAESGTGAEAPPQTSPVPAAVGPGWSEPVQMTVLYDNYQAVEGTRAEWGFSCLIEGTEKTILFDTGGEAEGLLHNVGFLGADLSRLDLVVISHEHADHTGGLNAVLERHPRLPVYIPGGLPYEFVRRVESAQGSVVPIGPPVEICRDVYLTGQMGSSILEQAVVLNAPQGLIVVTGCAHPGIVDMIRRARETLNRDIHLVFGGFHLGSHTDEQVKAIIEDFRDLGVQKCGATHCTGDRAIELFKEAYGADYVEIGVGSVLRFEDGGSR